MSYNGYPNYETWNAALWLDNSEGAQEYWNGRAVEAVERNGKGDEAVRELADELEADAAEGAEQATGITGFLSDMLTHALGMIEWFHIAQNYVDEVEVDESEAEAEIA